MSKKNTKWAYTLANDFSTCRRKYYFGYVLPNHYHSNPFRRKAFELKPMVNFNMWQGKVVDLVIEKKIIPAISNKKNIDFEEMVEFAVSLAKDQFEFSEKREYSKKGVIKTGNDKYQIIDVHELKIPFEEIRLQEVYDNIRKAILNFPKIQLPDDKMRLMEFLRSAYFLAPNLQDRTFTFENIYVSPQIDLLLYLDHKPVIIDWKLSDSDFSDYSRQLVICGLTIYMNRLEKWKSNGKEPYDYEDIRLYEVNLLKSEMKQHDFTAEIAQDMLDYIYFSGKDMAFGRQEKGWKDYELNDLEWAENENACKFCNFQLMCRFLFENHNQYDEKTYSQFLQNTELIEN